MGNVVPTVINIKQHIDTCIFAQTCVDLVLIRALSDSLQRPPAPLFFLVRYELRSASASAGNYGRCRLLHRTSANERFRHLRLAGAAQQRIRILETVRQVQSRLRRAALPVAALGQTVGTSQVHFSNSDSSSRVGVGARLRHVRSFLGFQLCVIQRKN